MKEGNVYEETMPVFIHYLGVLTSLIDHGIHHAKKTRGLNEQMLLTGRLAPDMFTFKEQIGYAYFMALEVATNLTGRAMPVFTYDEKNMAELKKSLRRATTFLKSIKPAEVKVGERKRVKTFLHPTKKFAPSVYVRRLALPNFFFHVVTAYDILRSLGVPLKKEYYLGLK